MDPSFQDVSNPDPTLELKQVKQEGLLVLRSIDTVLFMVSFTKISIWIAYILCMVYEREEGFRLSVCLVS
jgi:hypothetical protein